MLLLTKKENMMARQVTLHGTYLAFDGDRPIQRLFVETVTVKGRKIDADAIRTDLNKSFLEGGRNRAWALARNLVPHISARFVRTPLSLAVLGYSRAPMFEVVA
jgi:hypothetical protein